MRIVHLAAIGYNSPQGVRHMRDNTMVALVGMFALLLFLIVLIGPFFTIWSLNTLFQLEIQYSFQSWVAINWLMLMFHGARSSLKKSNQQT